MDLNKLKTVVPTSSGEHSGFVAGRVCKYDINTPLRASHFLGQIAHESGNFTIKTESLRYSTPQRIVNVLAQPF